MYRTLSRLSWPWRPILALLFALLLPMPAAAQDQVPNPLTYAAVTEPTSTEAHIALSFGADPVPEIRKQVLEILELLSRTL